MDKKDILRAASSGKSAEEIMKGLSREDREAVERLLSDKEATKRLLSTPQAKMLFEQLFGGNKNG